MLKSWKILLLFVLLFGLFTVVGCSEDDEDKIIGTWKLYSEDGEVVDYNFMVTFTDDGTFSYTITEDDFTESDSGTYSIVESVITIIFSDGETDVSTFVITDDTMTITDGDGVSILKR